MVSQRGDGGAELGTVACLAAGPQSHAEGICATKAAGGAQHTQWRRERGQVAGWSPSCLHGTQAARIPPPCIPGSMKRLQLSSLLCQALFSPKKLNALFYSLRYGEQKKKCSVFQFWSQPGHLQTWGRAGGRDGALVPAVGRTLIAGQRGPGTPNVTPAWPIPIPAPLPGALLGLWIKFLCY